MSQNQIELIEGTNRDVSKSQFFTPPKLAAKLVQWADIPESFGHHGTRAYRVLEPSAGNGALVRPLVAAGAHVTAVELDSRYTDDLDDLLGDTCNHQSYMGCDFLSLPADNNLFKRWQYDLCVGNFPFHADLTGAFTLHALNFAPRVCAIYPSNVFYSEQREELWKQVRPTRIAYMSKRAWPGATDYVALELVKREDAGRFCYPMDASIEWWHEAWS